jgi:hypothetical protein
MDWKEKSVGPAFSFGAWRLENEMPWVRVSIGDSLGVIFSREIGTSS